MKFATNLRQDSVLEAQGREPLTIAPDTPVRDVLVALQHQQVGTAIVVEEGRPIGIFTERDAIRLLLSDSLESMKIRDVMIAPVVTVPESTSVGQAIKLMEQGGYRRLPIVDDKGRLSGVVKVSGIVHYFVDHFPETVLNLAAPQGTSEREGA